MTAVFRSDGDNISTGSNTLLNMFNVFIIILCGRINNNPWGTLFKIPRSIDHHSKYLKTLITDDIQLVSLVPFVCIRCSCSSA